MKTLLYSILWIAAGYVLCMSVIGLDLSLNIFSWNPKLDGEAAIALTTIILSELFIVWLISKTKNTAVFVVSLLTCIALAAVGALAFTDLQNETISTGGVGIAALINRRTLSPMWYRYAILILFLIPLIVLGSYRLRRFIKSGKS